MSARKPTMVDVARHAGVSLKTVSRVVNREPHVSQELARRVQSSIDTLGFRRNEAASRLARRTAMLTLGLIVENISNEFYSRLARAVEVAAFDHEALVVFGTYEERPERERMLIESMYARGVDALIIVPSVADHGWLAEHRGLTAAFVDRIPRGVDGADTVLLDDQAGGRLAVEHLREHGHRRIALISDDDRLSSVHDRTRGYRTAMCADETLIVHGAFEPEEVEEEVIRLLGRPDPPTAFFATNNRAGIGVLRALRGRAQRPALVVFDDFTLADVFEPAVTVVRYDVVRLGRAVVELLLGRLREPTRPPQTIRLPVELVVRGSGELPPGRGRAR